MSSAVRSVDTGRLSAKSLLGFDFLFGIIPWLLLSPLLAIEFQSLWQRTSQSFFPIPILIVAGIAAWHLRSPRSEQPQRLFFARSLFLTGVGVFGVAVWKLSPFIAHCSLTILFLGWATERFGAVLWPRVMGWAALLATSIRLPGDLQSRVHDWLVQQSSALLGNILDGLSVPYLIRADAFNMRGLEFSLSEVCTSVYSINALVSALVLLLLLTRRSLLVAILSLLTVPFWAVVQMVLVLLAIVLFKQFSDRDASQGLDRALVELIVFMLVAGCGWATTYFLARLTLPVPAADSEFELVFLILNSIVCWPQPDPFAAGTPQIQPSQAEQQHPLISSAFTQRLSWSGSICLIAIGLFATYRVLSGGFAAPSTLPSIRAQQLARIQWKELLPEVFERLASLEVTHEIQRFESRDLGVIHWHFAWQGQNVRLSVTLPFKSRPPLASKYKALGWRVLSEDAKQYVPAKQLSRGEPSQSEWQSSSNPQELWTELKIANELGGQAVALVTYHPLLHQTASQILPERSSQPTMEYQVVLFCESGEVLSVPQLAELYDVFQQANEHLRAQVEPSLLELLGDAR